MITKRTVAGVACFFISVPAFATWNVPSEGYGQPKKAPICAGLLSGTADGYEEVRNLFRRQDWNYIHEDVLDILERPHAADYFYRVLQFLMDRRLLKLVRQVIVVPASYDYPWRQEDVRAVLFYFVDFDMGMPAENILETNENFWLALTPDVWREACQRAIDKNVPDVLNRFFYWRNIPEGISRDEFKGFANLAAKQGVINRRLDLQIQLTLDRYPH